MARILAGDVRRAVTGPETGHELADSHPVLVVSDQRIIDATNTAIVIPLTSTSPHFPVFWSISISDTDSWASVRHLRTLSVHRLRRVIGSATSEELAAVKAALYRELIDEPPEPAPVVNDHEPDAAPGTVWTAEIARAGGDFQSRVLILTSNARNGMATALHVDQEPRRNFPSIPITVGDPPETGHIVTYQARSISAPDRLGQYCGTVPANLLDAAKRRLIGHISAVRYA